LKKEKSQIENSEVFKKVVKLGKKPYCQNPECDNYLLDKPNDMLRIGSTLNKSLGKDIVQYRCKMCKKRVSQNLIKKIVEFDTRSKNIIEELNKLTEYMTDTEICEKWKVPRTTLKTFFKELHERDKNSDEADFLFSQLSPPQSFEIEEVSAIGKEGLKVVVYFIFKDGGAFLNKVVVVKDTPKNKLKVLNQYLAIAPVFMAGLQKLEKIQKCETVPRVGLPLLKALDDLHFNKMTHYSSIELIEYRMSLFKIIFNNRQHSFLESHVKNNPNFIEKLKS
jgi:hypothetical protein